MSIRVRYAPSPTGLQHIGGIRTAVFDYFFAKANGGKFILRIEDTDQVRTTDEAIEDLYSTLKWLDIQWDEGPDIGGEYGPYVQSERTEIYRKYTKQLIDQGNAYYCYCTPERLDKLRKEQKEKKSSIQGYDRHCRTISASGIEEAVNKGIKPVVRLKIPLEGSTVFHDELLGDIKRKNIDINPDPVILKSDGYPTYHLANVIDDHLMKITHILRAQEWLPSGPLHIILYNAFGWEPPKYCHLPMVMGKDGQKLSKRHGSTSVTAFREAGYLPEAVLNYISLLGWSFDDSREFFSKEDLEKLFTLEKINKASSVFDYKKLEWFNGQYIRKLSDEEFTELILPELQKTGIISDPVTDEENKILKGMLSLIKERMKIIKEVSGLVSFLFRDVKDYNIADIIPKKLDAAKTLEIITVTRGLVSNLYNQTDEEAEESFRKAGETLEVKLGSVLMPVRVALTGSRISPPLFGALRLIGKEKALSRIDNVIELLRSEVK